jgi:hypothetical protein
MRVFVILNPSLCHPEPFACHPEQSEGSPSLTQGDKAKGLGLWLRACPEGTEGINSVKNLIISTESTIEVLRIGASE